MTPEIITVVLTGGVVLLSVWKMCADLGKHIADLRERMASLEGEVRGFMAGFKAQSI